MGWTHFFLKIFSPHIFHIFLVVDDDNDIENRIKKKEPVIYLSYRNLYSLRLFINFTSRYYRFQVKRRKFFIFRYLSLLND